MVEKFSDFEGAKYLDKAGEFVFEITDYELKESKSGKPMAVFKAKSDAGETTLYHVLEKNTKWSYNNLIKCCLKLDTAEKINAFECDYELIGHDLVGKKFIGVVTVDTYVKEVKKLLDDGTFDTTEEVKESFKITEYKMI